MVVCLLPLPPLDSFQKMQKIQGDAITSADRMGQPACYGLNFFL